ncbi:hypothetical protein I4U23_026577 [Adineta vaga]|nr:hypothetical protein I4U23_026577 [Adineta vaga]
MNHYEQLINIQPRLCILHKWAHFDGYGIHLSCNKHSLGLRIDDIELNSPAENGGLLRGDIVLAVNGHFIANDDFFAILLCIEFALEQDSIRFLVLDANSADLAQRYQINIDENHENCMRIETSQVIGTFKEYPTDQWSRNNQIIPENSSITDSSNNVKSELRMCSVILRSTIDTIGISIEPDRDFGHIITYVQPDSPAALAGLECDHHIISLNHISLIHLPFEDVLYHLKKSRHETKLDFLVAKKSYLFQVLQTHSSSVNTEGETVPSVNRLARTKSAALPTMQTSEQILRQPNVDNQQRETISSLSDEQYDRLSLQIYSNRYSAKHKKKQGKVFDGIGPATDLRISWSLKSEKTVDYSSVHSDLYRRRSGVNEAKKGENAMKVSFNLLQVGMTNPSPKQQTRRILAREPSQNSCDNEKHSTQSPSFLKRLRNSPKILPSPSSSLKKNSLVHTPSPSMKLKQTISNIRKAISIVPLPIERNEEQG